MSQLYLYWTPLYQHWPQPKYELTETAKKQIDGLTKENFSSTLSEIEPFLLNDAGTTIYKKSIRRITTKAKSFGVELPSDFARAAKATEKRRAKQDEFIQAKEAERLEAEAAAAPEEEAEVEAEEPVPVEA